MIDQAVSIDLPARRVVRQLYEAASKAIGGKTLCFTAAEKMARAIDKGDFVFILTGFPIPPLNIAETDGPLGAAVLAHTCQTLGLKPVLVTDDTCFKVVEAAVPKTKVIRFPVDAEQASSMAERLLNEYEPSVIVAVERPGWNKEQEYHNMRGVNISGIVGKTDYLLELSRKHGALTIGVGDGGNELGCGLIEQAVRKHVPNGAHCQCPCNGGIAAATSAEVLVVSGVSNWGAYGISACLSLLKGWEYKHTRQNELRLLKRVVKAGAIDSMSLQRKPFVDGLSPSINGLVVDLICTVTNA